MFHLAVVAIALVATAHPRAPLAAVIACGALGLGAAASHLLPAWSVFSDPLPGSAADAFIWTAVVLEVGASLVFAALGWWVLTWDRAGVTTG